MEKSLWILALTASLAACVTINIYFPAAAANKAADKIIDDVWQLKPGEHPADAPAAPQAEQPAVVPANKDERSNHE